MNGSNLISGRVAVGVLGLIGLHLVAFHSPETLSMILYWGSFIAVGLFVGTSSPSPFSRGLVTSLLGSLASWAVLTHGFGQVSDERGFFAVLVFLLPVTSLLGGASAGLGGRVFRGKSQAS